MIAYLDSSALLRIAFEEPNRLADWSGYDARVASVLIEVECLRVLDQMRWRRDVDESDLPARRSAVLGLLDQCDLIELSRPILRRAAEPFPVSLGTLDALHLATALAWQEQEGQALLMATHDGALGSAAKAMGMTVLGISA